MRPIVFSVCVLAAACSVQDPTSPTAPTSALPAAAAAAGLPGQAAGPQGRDGSGLPFKGSFTLQTQGNDNCAPPPPEGTCPPTTLVISGTVSGTATHLGGFVAATVDNVDVATNTATGTWTFTAANGDQLFADTVGVENQFTPPSTSHAVLRATITGGTGRYVGAGGMFTVQLTQEIDFVTNTATGSGSFTGTLDLNK